MTTKAMPAQDPVDVDIRKMLDEMMGPLQDAAIQLTGLCEVLCLHTQETIGRGDFTEAQNLAWSYECLAALAGKFAQELSDAAP